MKNTDSHSAAKAGISNSFKDKSFTKKTYPCQKLNRGGVSERNLHKNLQKTAKDRWQPASHLNNNPAGYPVELP